jgi:uncharacterized protein
MSLARIHVPEPEIAAFCRENCIRKLSLFGSVLTERFADTSDVDVLVEFDPSARVGYFKMATLERQLTELLGRKVDLRTPEELSRYFRDDVARVALTQYDSQ